MGETDDKDVITTSTPAKTTNNSSSNDTNNVTETAEHQENDKSKETDTLLKSNEKTTTEKVAEVLKDAKKSLENLTNGEEISKVPDAVKDVVSKVSAEEREVKPKKIPIGAIKMPGFFTRNKDKNKDGDGAENELLENAGNEEKTKEEEEVAPVPKPGFFAKFRRPFAKRHTPLPASDEESPAPAPEGNGKPKENGDSKEEVQGVYEKTDDKENKQNKDTEAANESTASKKSFIGAIRLPQIAKILPKRFKAGNPDDIELGNGPRAGLASTETLDDPLKDVADSANSKTATLDADGLETVKLSSETGATKDEAKAAEAAEDKPKKTFMERVRGYRCSIDDVAIIAGIIVFFLLVAIIIAFTFIGKSEPKEAPLRDGKFIEAVTSCGNVEGVLEDGAFAFRGIPYAIPPTGENRWRPSNLIENLDSCWNGTLKTHNSTDVCLQQSTNGTEGVEDCLTLDVVTPHVRYDNALPVVVLIGAETLNGDSPGKMRPTTRYARARDVIFVRPNFRLGVFGFLALDTLSKTAHPPSSGNYGLSDIITCLKWVQLNIAHFGGDPKHVTLFGHRAGGTLVHALSSIKMSKELFARAWITSSSANFPGRPLAESEKANLEFLTAVECSDAECLRGKEADDLIKAVPDTWQRTWPDLPSVDENTTARHEWLVLDGNILKQPAQDTWDKEPGAPRLVIGTTAHEAHSEKLYLREKEWTPELVRKHLSDSRIGQLGLVDEVLKRYNATYQGLVSIISDVQTICPLLVNARNQPSAAFYVVTQTGGELSLAHVEDDVQAIFGRYEPKTPEQRRYVSAIQQLFYHYVSHGELKQADPRRRVIEIGQDALNVEDYPNCDFWIKSDFVPRYARLD